jgi:hypothetical protein
MEALNKISPPVQDGVRQKRQKPLLDSEVHRTEECSQILSSRRRRGKRLPRVSSFGWTGQPRADLSISVGNYHCTY